MYARTTSWTGTPEALEKWARDTMETVAPMVAGLPGNAGAYFFIDREAGQGLTLTLWENEDAARASDATADKSRARTVAATGVELLDRGRYELTAKSRTTPDNSRANKEVSRRFTELFGTPDAAGAEDILSRDIVFHGTAGDGEIRGLDQMKAFLIGYHSAFPGAHSTVEDQVAEGDKVVTRWRARGAHRGDLGPIPATGRAFEMDGVTIERIADGKIAEVWVARDELGLLRQLGVLPEPADARA
jgi:steroid delta-isomerase-like uncharacterized protein